MMHDDITLPAATGTVAKFLGIREPKLQQLIRRRRFAPVPPIFGGRRQWDASHIVAAAQALGQPTEKVSQRLVDAHRRQTGGA